VLHEFLGSLDAHGGAAHHAPRRRRRPVVPPRSPPIQAVVIAVRDEPEVNDACDAVAASLKSAGVRVQIDCGRGSFRSSGHRLEIKGVPLRVEVGPVTSRQVWSPGAPRQRGQGATGARHGRRQRLGAAR